MRPSHPVHLPSTLELLRSWGVTTSLSGPTPRESLQAASLFHPIAHGFYFFTGTTVPDTIRKSAILTPFGARAHPSNTLIQVSADPQRLFYRILREYYSARSTGSISPLAVVDPEASLGENVEIGPFCVIGRCTIGDNAMIRSGTHIRDDSTVGAHTIIEPQSMIGAVGMAWVWNEEETERIVMPQLGGVVVGEHCLLGAQTVLVRGSINEVTSVGDGTVMAPGCRVGHGTQIGRNVHFANNVVTGGNSVVGDYSFLGSASVLRVRVRLHPHTVVGAGAVVVKDTQREGLTLVGVPATARPTKESPSGMPRPKKRSSS